MVKSRSNFLLTFINDVMVENYYYENREEIRRKVREKYRKDKEYREKLKKYYREKYHSDPEYKKMTLENARNRYYNDPEYRERTIQRAKDRALRLKNEKAKATKTVKKKTK